MNKTKGEVKDFFKKKLSEFNEQLAVTKNIIQRISTFRIITFLITVLGIYIATNMGWATVILVVFLGFGVFIFLVIKQSKLMKNKGRIEALVAINETEIDLLSRKQEHKNEGKQYISDEHPFATDLDIFGKKSLFQLIDRSATNRGEEKLAETLNNPIKSNELLLKRQQAVKELAEKPSWRQEFQATGKLFNESASAIDGLINWASEKSNFFNKPIYRLFLFLNPIIGFGVVFLIVFYELNFSLFLLFLLLPFSILVPKLNLINRQHGLLSKKSELLTKYAELFKLFEKEAFASEIILSHKKLLSGSQNSASFAVEKLSKISAKFDFRLNFLVGIFLNIFFLWDILQSIRLEKWKSSHGIFLNEWFESMAEIDELSSFAGFAFAHPESTFPIISTNEFELTATNLKHPFLESENCVGNDVAIGGLGQFRIITGANMAGKSTYLRTVGINLILAMTGSPVIAENFVFTPTDLFTGIKTSDSLQEGESYFFAELKRLKEIINHLEKGQTLFVILDEILRGTNSADKQKGSKALIEQLIGLKASGLIATHDLALGELADLFPKNVQNQRFEVEIENNELKFDYLLKEGVSQNLNATFLMKKMGITV
ncbi:MAG TPA: hypothetical protein VIN10_09700 [Bacteroidales bacterium]